MDDLGATPGEDPDFLERFLSDFLGVDGAAEAAQVMKERGFSVPKGLTPDAMSQAMQQLRFVMDSSTAPVNWRVVEDLGRQLAYLSPGAKLSAAQAQAARQSLAVADLWLDPVTDFTHRGCGREAWTAVEWSERTLPAWKPIFNPVAGNVARAMAEAISLPEKEEWRDEGPQERTARTLQSLVPKLSAMMFGAQIGQALGAMAKETLGASDAGLPLTEGGTAALVPQNIERLAAGLGQSYEEVCQYLAVREMAHARLFKSVPWLREDLQLALERYAREIEIDPEAIAQAAASMDPSDPESLNQAMSNGVFAAAPSEPQARALQRLETLLSLVEGWVETTTTAAVAPYLPQADALRETLRRRRVTGSPAETLLAQVVGLKLRPRQARAASEIFRRLQNEGGAQARDSVWSHPDTVPSAEDLENPQQFSCAPPGGEPASDVDRQLQELLDGTLGWNDAVPREERGSDEADS